MFMRIGKLQTELPAPKKKNPNAAAALQKLLGGKYGEMSTLGNYMFESFVPQAWRILKTRDTAALSAPMYSMTTVAFLLWLLYGILKGEWPLILTNGICFILAGFILAMTLAFAKQKAAVSDALQ